MIALTHRIDRTVVIHARPSTVFGFLSRTQDWAAWWGLGSAIDARPGGRMLIRHANGVEVVGEVLEVDPPHRIAFTYGYAAGTPIPPGASKVTVRLDEHPVGTLLQLTHEFADADALEQHEQGWRFQLSLFSNAIANKVNAAVEQTVDGWFRAWSDPDGAPRERLLDTIVARGVRFRDKFSAITGLDEVKAHLAAVHRFMPGLRLERRGDVRHCQWHVLADWVAMARDGAERGRGTNLFAIDADGRIAEVTGFWNA